ncbi:unnamed protein product [Ixodes pacificus]
MHKNISHVHPRKKKIVTYLKCCNHTFNNQSHSTESQVKVFLIVYGTYPDTCNTGTNFLIKLINYVSKAKGTAKYTSNENLHSAYDNFSRLTIKMVRALNKAISMVK